MIAKHIIQDLKDGSPEAFEAIYDLFHKPLLTYCFKHTRSKETAEELIHDVFIRLWESRLQIDAERNFKGYLYAITYNVTMTWMMKTFRDKKMKTAFTHKYMEEQRTTHQENRVAASIDLDILKKGLNYLPEQRKKVFELCKFSQLTYGEVAERLGLSPKTVKKHMSLAIKDFDAQMNAGHFISIGFILSYLFSAI